MVERVELWWARRRFSRGAEVPYAVGTYREAWAPYPALIRQYHPELNAGIVLTQIPPAADVLLLWQCEAGHTFVATPSEQRSRPGRERRRSAWCPDCSVLAKPPPIRRAGERMPRPPKQSRPLCPKTPELPKGEPFASECAPRPASAVEARLRADVFARLAVTPGLNAVRVARPFFDHLEVWPDILLPELRVAIEYDSTGRHGLEHVGRREDADRRKDRALRAVGWEVLRIRTGRLEPLGPYDLQLSSVGARSLGRIVDVLRDIRGPLLVDAYLT
ncbi:zinc-ribbon domain-containing protein [Microbacterium sulfonylureivorans]|uniref:zinc-ribbon domain-containing protein n=1 Tax=Microbacterium sulfonylureivorans TaxID=2486854 RepID=UPI000FDBD121|nr:zinc-ribbon domain-containing protein [Microbacterium sulfonylureivorans]